MMKKTTSILMLLAMLAAGVQTAFAQSVPDGSTVGNWYAGLSGGTSFGQYPPRHPPRCLGGLFPFYRVLG